MSDDMNELIRGRAGRAPVATPEMNSAASEAQRAAALAAGLPARLAHRLVGDGDALAADARSFAEQLGGGNDMDAQIRRAAGRTVNTSAGEQTT